jgi:hypothetical protein
MAGLSPGCLFYHYKRLKPECAGMLILYIAIACSYKAVAIKILVFTTFEGDIAPSKMSLCNRFTALQRK